MATVACAEAASLPVKMLAKLHRHLQSVSLYEYVALYTREFATV